MKRDSTVMFYCVASSHEMELLRLITTYVLAALLSTSADAISPILIGMKGSTSICMYI